MTSDYVNVVKEELYNPDRPRETCNLISKELQESLRKRKLGFEKSEHYLWKLGVARDSRVNVKTCEGVSIKVCEEETREVSAEVCEEDTRGVEGESVLVGMEEGGVVCCGGVVHDESGDVKTQSDAVTDEGVIRLGPREKRKVE